MKYREIILKQTDILKQSLHLENYSNEEISRLVWNPELHYLLLKISLLIPVLRRINLQGHRKRWTGFETAIT